MVKFPEEPRVVSLIQVHIFEDGDVFVSGAKANKFPEEKLAKALCIALAMVAIESLTKAELLSEVSKRWDEIEQKNKKGGKLWDTPEV